MEDKDIWRSAQAYIKRYGDDAKIHAAMRADEKIHAAFRADEMLGKGDLDGAATWRRVIGRHCLYPDRDRQAERHRSARLVHWTATVQLHLRHEND